MSDELHAAPDPASRKWIVRYYDATLRLTDEQYLALTKAADDDPQEALRLAEKYLANGEAMP